MSFGRKAFTPVLAAAAAVFLCTAAAASGGEETVFVEDGAARSVRVVGTEWTQGDGYLEQTGVDNYLLAGRLLEDGDFHVRVRLSLDRFQRTAASFMVGGNHLGFDGGGGGRLFVEGTNFGNARLLHDAHEFITPGTPFLLEAVRRDGTLSFLIDGKEAFSGTLSAPLQGAFGLRPWRGTLRVYDFSASGLLGQIRELDAVFAAGSDGYHTYRIPALVVTNEGTLLAFCEGRKTGRGDAGDIDIVLKRSLDNGATWSEQAVVHEEGGGEKITIGNPAPVVDRETGTVWLAFCRNNDRVFVTQSSDDGATWAAPREITSDVKEPDWTWYATGPVNGIQVRHGPHEGRLLIPCDHHVGAGSRNWRERGRSHVIYSDDHGATWRLGGATGFGTNECTVVELAGGALMLNMRCYLGRNRRAVATSRNGGITWSEASDDPVLVEPVCQASIVRLDWPEGDDEAGRILFSNPAAVHRVNMTVRVSLDEGATWAASRTVHAGPSAYSSLAALPNGEVGLLYEAGIMHPYETISFTRFPVDWLSGAEAGER